MVSLVVNKLEKMAKKSATSEYYDILLLGRTGQGKSTTGNKLMDIVAKECPPNEFTYTEDKTIPFFIVGEGADSITRYCKVFTNPETQVRVVDTPGLDNTLKKDQNLYETNLEVIRQILSTQKEHEMKFSRLLYFLPVRGPLERATKDLQDQIKVMYGFFGRQIFNIMVIVATNHEDSRRQTPEFNEHDRKKTEVAFMTAFKRTTNESLKACPPILYLSVNEEEVLKKVRRAEVLHSGPLPAPLEVSGRCAKCAKKLIYIDHKVIARVIENEGLYTEKEILVDDSKCHPYFIPKPRKSWMKFWFFDTTEEICACCKQPPGSKGCRDIKEMFKRNTPTSTEEIEVCHSTKI